MKVHVQDFKRVAVAFIDNEVIPKSPSDKKIWYIGMGILAPKMIDKYMDKYAELLQIAEVIDEDHMVCIDEAESFFSQLLTKSDGFVIMGVKFNAEDIHKLADMARHI